MNDITPEKEFARVNIKPIDESPNAKSILFQDILQWQREADKSHIEVIVFSITKDLLPNPVTMDREEFFIGSLEF